MNALKTSILLAVFLVAGCANKTKEADRLNDEVKSEVCRIKETLPPMSAALTAAERDAAVAGALALLSEKARKSPALIAKTRDVNTLVKDLKPSDRFTYLFDANRLDESTVRQIVTLNAGISSDKAKAVNKAIKELGLKGISSQTQGDQVRVSSPDKDALQDAIAVLRKADFEVELQFGNFR